VRGVLDYRSCTHRHKSVDIGRIGRKKGVSKKYFLPVSDRHSARILARKIISRKGAEARRFITINLFAAWRPGERILFLIHGLTEVYERWRDGGGKNDGKKDCKGPEILLI
jgi:hypothetical protein